MGTRPLCEARLPRAQVAQDAAAKLGVDQPKVSALARGNLAGFSMDRLLRFAMALGYDVELSLRRSDSRGSVGSMQVA